MTHYICTGGCGGVSEHPGVCQDESCVSHKHELVECNCVDGLHEQVLSAEKEDEEEFPMSEPEE